MARLVRQVFATSSRLLCNLRTEVPLQLSVYRVPVLGTALTQWFCSQTQHQEAEEGNTEETSEQIPEKEGLWPVHDVDTSIQYMQSTAYKTTYRDVPVWMPYRRNHKGRFPPQKTRKRCIRAGKMATGNPCPICRDEYLVVHPRNFSLLKQFISPLSGELISYTKTGVCQRQHRNLQIAIMQAWDLGYLEMPFAQRRYDYSQYYPQLQDKHKQ